MAETGLTPRFHPLLIVKPKTMTRADIRRAEKLGGICVVECAEPETARFVEPPLHMGGDVLSIAAVSLVKLILSQAPQARLDRNEIAKWYVDMLIKGAQPGTTPTTPIVPPVKR